MELIDLVDEKIVADFRTVPLLAQYEPRKRDSAEDKEGEDEDNPLPYSVTIASEDRGDFKQAPGMGIKLIGLEITIEYNLGSETDRAARTALLVQLAEAVGNRLPTTLYDTQEARDVLNRLSTSKLRVFLIASDESEKRTDLDLTRTRIITRELICAQIA